MDTVELTTLFGDFCRQSLLPLFINAWRFPDPDAIEKDDGDWVGALDVAIQAQFLDFAGQHLPGLPMVSEEADNWPPGYPPPLMNWWEAERYGVLDPLDGTHNHLMGFRAESVMLTIVEEGKPIFSAIFDPNRELATADGYFTADLFTGAALQHRFDDPPVRLRVSEETDLGNAMGLIEGSTRKIAESNFAQRYMRSVRRWRSTLGFGQSVLLLASGGNHAAGPTSLVSIGNKFTDNVHGVSFTELAGGTVTKSDGGPWTLDSPERFDLLFLNGHVRGPVLGLVNGGR